MLKTWLARPRVYEIARTQAFALKPKPVDRASDAAATAAAAKPDACKSPEQPEIHPPLPFFFSDARQGLTVSAGFVVGIGVGLWALYHLLRIYVWSFRDASDRTLVWLRAHKRVFFLCALAVLIAAAVALRVPFDVYGEPFAWADGISLWPTEMIRILALVLSLYFIARTLRPVELDPKKPNGDFFAAEVKGAGDAKSGKAARVYEWYKQHRDQRGNVNAERLWKEFRALERPMARYSRLQLPFLFYMILSVCLMLAFGDLPVVPYRGTLALAVDKVVLFLSVTAFLVLLFLVIDVIRLSSTMIRNLSVGESEYPQAALNKLRAELNFRGESNEPLCELLDIRLISAYTEQVNRLVYYPFVVLALMVVARSSIFDNWYMPPALAIIFLCAFLVTVLCATVLQQVAARARRIALERMTGFIARAHGESGAPDGYVAQLEMMLEEIRRTRRGAFLPLLQQPLVKAILVPLGSFGGLQLFEVLLLRLYS
jgi:hypothetical protein